jgi:hypothetical protein
MKLDINWVGVDDLLDLIDKRGAAAWYMFLRGNMLRDPAGVVGLCETAITLWFQAHPEVLEAWNRQQAAVESFKADRTGTLEFPTQPAFLNYLESRERS